LSPAAPHGTASPCVLQVCRPRLSRTHTHALSPAAPHGTASPCVLQAFVVLGDLLEHCFATFAEMNYSVPDPGGLAPAALVALRGADPMITIPAGHVYLRLRPSAPYVIPPGALAGSALPFSHLQATLGALVRTTAAIAGQPVLLHVVGITFYEAALAQAVVDGLPVVAYGDNAALHMACVKVVRSLSAAAIHAAYAPAMADLV